MLEKRKYLVNVINAATGQLAFKNGVPLGFETDHAALFVDTPELDVREGKKGILLQPVDLLPGWANSERIEELVRGAFALIHGLMPREKRDIIHVLASVSAEMVILFEDLVGPKKAAAILLHVAEDAARDALQANESAEKEDEDGDVLAEIDPEFFNTGEEESEE